MEMIDLNKNSDWRNSRGIYALLSILSAVAGAICLTCIPIAVAVANMMEVSHLNKHDIEVQGSNFMVHFANKAAQGELVGKFVIAGIAAFVFYLTGLVLLSVMTGHFKRDENDKIVLSRFDRIWSEIPVCMVFACIGVSFVPMIVIAGLMPAQDYFGMYTPYYPDPFLYKIDNDIMLVLLSLALAAIVAVGDIFFVMIIKKIKAGKFLETALLGKLFKVILNGFDIVIQSIRNSDRLVLKTVGFLIGAVLISMTGGGAVVVIILIIGLVPKYVRKYQIIKDGLKRVNSGELDYEIPYEEDDKGPKTELDKIAIEINKISKTTEEAVKNEVKNQTLKNELISNVSHDIKTPLTSMISYLDILQKEGLDSPHAHEYLDIVIDKTNRLKTLTEDLFEAAKASSGDMPCDIMDINMVSMVEQSLVEMEDKLSEHNLNVITNYDAENSMVKADGRLLFRVIENILGNIAKYSLEGSRVYIDVYSDDSMVYMTAKNISRDQLNISPDELMERFKRGDEARNTEGSGLGLTIANDLTSLMDGDFRIEIDGDMFKAIIGLHKA